MYHSYLVEKLESNLIVLRHPQTKDIMLLLLTVVGSTVLLVICILCVVINLSANKKKGTVSVLAVMGSGKVKKCREHDIFDACSSREQYVSHAYYIY